VPAIPSWLLEPLWDQFAALLPDRPVYHPAHPLGCHKPRIADRIIFEKLIQVLRFGCSYAGQRPGTEGRDEVTAQQIPVQLDRLRP
jgi:hypothetical protein